MPRARGSSALLAAQFETTYGVPPTNNYMALPFVTSALGEERPLIQSDLLGQGREGYDPTPDVSTNDGDVVVPVDVRRFGQWLKLLFGAPATTGAAAAATGVLTLTGNVADGDTVTIGGKVYTFQATLTNADGRVHVGASAAASITNLYNAINAAGGTSGTDYAAATTAHPTVAATASTAATLTVSARAPGAGGNAIALVETSANASWSGASLAGGTLASHLFTSGAAILPSMSVEVGMPEVPSYGMNFGVLANTMAISMGRSGLLNATMGLVAQGETITGTSNAGTPTSVTVERFAQATGVIRQGGAVLADVVSAQFTYSNNLDKVEVIRADGRIAGADPGMAMMSGSIVARFDDTSLLAVAQAGTPVDLSFGWNKGSYGLLFDVPRVFLPTVKRSITGPAGIQVSFNWQASGQGGHTCTATLTNDVAGYA